MKSVILFLNHHLVVVYIFLGDLEHVVLCFVYFLRVTLPDRNFEFAPFFSVDLVQGFDPRLEAIEKFGVANVLTPSCSSS